MSREEARQLIDERDDLVVVETLDEKYFRKFHLPGARNVPLNEGFEGNIADVAPETDTPILVYCMDAECEASSKAARKLEQLGYTEVFDYEAGKVDWMEAGLPVEENSD
ncbi:MAG: rhodanese-like domain-containing protein [Planctomycetaceae bacterium]|nr:rhodanese-like domain-containing protein [Planctomycetaceae bacterium]